MRLSKSFLIGGLLPHVGAAARHADDTLHPGTPESVGLLPEPLKDMQKNVSAYEKPANYGDSTDGEVRPIQASAAVIVGHDNTIVSHFASGQMLLYADVEGTKLPESEQIQAEPDTIYDMASLTKIYTTIAALRQLDAGSIALDEPVASYLPDFAANGKEAITLQMLLTHTSGFPSSPNPPLYDDAYKTVEERKAAVINHSLSDTPGSTFLYSDLNLMTVGILLETVTGKGLDELVKEYTDPLGMRDTFFNRGNVEGSAFAPYPRIAAQEFQPDDVMGRAQPVRGVVHDENAWSLEGVSGHAGLFSTVGDTAIFCQMILNGGSYGGFQALKPETVDLLFHNYNEQFEGDEHGLGFELNQYYTAGPMASLETASHTGFTGTTIVIDRPTNTFFLLFANRIHPDRNWSSNNIVRKALGYWVAKSLGREVDFPST